jgi:hypothetical protein
MDGCYSTLSDISWSTDNYCSKFIKVAQGLYTSKGPKSMTFSEFPRPFSLKFHDIFVNCHDHSEVTTTSDQQKQYVFTVITLLRRSQLDLAWTGVYSRLLYCLPLTWTVYTVIPDTFLGHVGREGPSNWGEKNKINAK